MAQKLQPATPAVRRQALTARRRSGQSYAEEKRKLQVRIQRAARCAIRPSQQSQMLSVMQELCSEPAKKVYALSVFHYLTPPVWLLMALLLKSDLGRCTCPTAHTTPPGPSLIARNSMYSLNTGWQRERCRATLALRQLGEGRQERGRISRRSRAAGAGGGWAGRVCTYVPSLPPHWASLVGKSKGEDDRRMALLSPHLCPPPVGAPGGPPGTGESRFAALQGVLPGESRLQWRGNKSRWELVFAACSRDCVRAFLF